MSPSTEVRENREFAAEIKFLVSPLVADQIRDWARGRLAPDPNSSEILGDGYRTTSLYFDTQQFDVFHRRGSFGRSKYRIRRYGHGSFAFLERKLKTRGLVSKRRSVVALDILAGIGGNESDGGGAGRWFQRRLQARRLQVVAQISYRRTALAAMTGDGPIRLTLDHDIRAVRAGQFAFNNIDTGMLLLENQVILELKFLRTMPGLFRQLIEEFCLDPVRVSKYRLAAAALGLVPQDAEMPPRLPIDPPPPEIDVCHEASCRAA